MTSCRVCGNEDKNISFTAREMFIGFRDEFKYYQCSKCGCLQIKEIPSDMYKYYPENYYSFNSFNIMSESNTPKSLVVKGKKYLQKKIIEYSFGKKNFAGLFFTKRYRLPAWAE